MATNLSNHRARAKKYGVPCTLTLKEWRKILEASKGFCCYCKQYASIELLTLDHIVPLSKGGAHAADNVAVACGYCNAQKKNQSGNIKLRIYPFIEKDDHFEIWDVVRLLGFKFETEVQALVRKGHIIPAGIWRKNCRTPLFSRSDIEARARRRQQVTDAIKAKI